MNGEQEQNWTDMLAAGGPVPPEVIECGERLQSGGVWWRPSLNYKLTEVYSCGQAIKFRERLGSGGNGGVPLWAELKSMVGLAVEPAAGKKIGFAAHARANTQFNHRVLLDALGMRSEGAHIQMIVDEESSASEEAVKEEVGAVAERSKISDKRWFGKVNPFNIDQVLADFTGQEVRLEDVPQILDASLQLDGGTPDTIMSNLGSRVTAFEVKPRDLISVITRLSPLSFVAPISEPSPVWLGLAGVHRKDYWLQFPPARGPKIGILTGNSPESGITLWRDMLKVLRGLYPKLPDTLMPEVHIHSLPEMGLSMELISREEEVWQAVRKGVDGLLSVGCTIITFACNTTIYYEPKVAELCAVSGARFVSIAEACMPAVRRVLGQSPKGASVGLVGIGPVVDMSGGFSGYKRHLEAEGVRVSACPAEELAFAVKSRGTDPELVTDFRRRIKEAVPSEAVVVILALTEVSMVYRDHVAKAAKNRKPERTFIDPLLELGKYLSFLYLAHGYRECSVCQIPDWFNIDEKLMEKIEKLMEKIE